MYLRSTLLREHEKLRSYCTRSLRTGSGTMPRSSLCRPLQLGRSRARMSLSIQYLQLCDLHPEVLSQTLTLCTADWSSVRQVNQCLKLAVALKVRMIHIRPQSRSQAEAVDPSKQKSPQALQRQYPVLRQVRTLGSFFTLSLLVKAIAVR